MNRRELLIASAQLIGASTALASTQAVSADSSSTSTATTSDGYRPVVTLNGSTLPWQMQDGFKVFHLIAEPCQREFAPGMMVNAWGL